MRSEGHTQRVPARPLLAARHWATIAEAGLALAIASAATRLLPYHVYIQFGVRAGPRRRHGDAEETARIVAAVARRVPFRAVCLQRGIALQWMLRRRGVDAILHYGVRIPGRGKDLAAHVWVSVAGRVLIGAPEHENHAEVARYPSA